jgi:glutathione synthase/RimK-type ligase-like ATP-grasp enzyme
MPAARLNIVMGLPDDQKVHVAQVSTAGVEITHIGTASFLPYLRNELEFNQVWLGPGAAQVSHLEPGPLINYIAEPDACRLSLKAALENASRLGRLWFNHPQHIINTTRDQVSKSLQGISGLIVPQTIRLKPARPTDILSALRNQETNRPTLVRIAGHHAGETLIRIENDRDEGAVSALPWGGQELYVTQFHDFKDADGRYRKWRIAVIGGVPILNHVFIGESWMVSGDRRLWDSQVQREVEEHYRMFPARVSKFIGSIVDQIYSRLKLDYFGIDCTVAADDTIVLFEANACMDLFRVASKITPSGAAAKTLLKTELINLLQNPNRWVEAKCATNMPISEALLDRKH